MSWSLVAWKALKKVVPRTERRSLRCLEILAGEMGHTRSQREASCVDASGRPIPWYTYPAIQYLDQLDWSDAEAFEYGSGNSTLFWGERVAHVTAVESDAAWHERVCRQARDLPAEILFIPDREPYVERIAESNRRYDLVVVDGLHRGSCAEQAIKSLKRGGLVIVDNSDWYPGACALLRDSGLIQIDMFGFGPINAYTWTTSLFLHREFKRLPKGSRQPLAGIGGLPHQASDDWAPQIGSDAA